MDKFLLNEYSIAQYLKTLLKVIEMAIEIDRYIDFLTGHTWLHLSQAAVASNNSI